MRYRPAAILIALLVNSFQVGAPAQTGQSDVIAKETTLGFWNGRFWKAISTDGRLNFVMGYNSGVRFVPLNDPESATLAGHKKKIAEFFAPDQTFAESAAAVDAFYAEPENARLPIPWAIQITSSKAMGASAAELQARIEGMRRSVANQK